MGEFVPTSDDWHFYQEWKGSTKLIKAKRLKRARELLDDGGWTLNTPWHWSRIVEEEAYRPYSTRIDFWPTTNKAIVDHGNGTLVETLQPAFAPVAELIGIRLP